MDALKRMKKILTENPELLSREKPYIKYPHMRNGIYYIKGEEVTKEKFDEGVKEFNEKNQSPKWTKEQELAYIEEYLLSKKFTLNLSSTREKQAHRATKYDENQKYTILRVAKEEKKNNPRDYWLNAWRRLESEYAICFSDSETLKTYVKRNTPKIK